MISLRARVALGILACHLAILGTGAYLGYGTGKRVLTAQFDASLATKAATFATLLDQRGSHVELHFADEVMREYVHPVHPEYFQIWIDGTDVLERSYALRGTDLPLRYGTLEEPLHWDHTLPDGRDGRLVGVRLPVHEVRPDPKTGASFPAEDVVIVLAKGREALDGLLRRLLGGILSGGVLLLLGAFLVTAWAVRVSLRPVDSLGDEVSRVDVATLSGLMEENRYPLELAPVVTALNGLRQRLDEALRAERRTANNIAHELKTPISELRALTEVALQDGEDHEFGRRALEQAYDISIQMESLVGVVRMLTRIDAGRGDLPMEPLPIDAMLASAKSSLESLARERGLSLTCGGSDGPVVRTNREALWIILSNLLRNAVEYSPAGSEVRWTVASNGEVTSIRIANPCTGLRREDLDRLTEPFWRATASRTDADHHGLGLTLAVGMADLAGIGLGFELEGDVLIARVSIPP